MKTSLPSGQAHGWGVAGKYLSREIAKLPFLEGVTLHCIAGHDLRPMNLSDWTRINIGYCFFENDAETLRHTSRAAGEWDYIVAGSTWCEKHLRAGGIDKTTTILQGIDPNNFYPLPYRPDDGKFVVFSGGKFEYRKGQDLVIAAMRVFMQRHPDAYLVGAWYNQWPFSMATMKQSTHIRFPFSNQDCMTLLQETLRENGIPLERAFLAPLVDNTVIKEIFQQTDIGLFPNRCEGGNNMVMCEYMACDRTVIASNATGHADIITEQNAFPLAKGRPLQIFQDGQLIGNWDEPSVEEILEKLEFAYAHRELCRQKAAAAVDDMKKLAWDKAARDFHALGRKLLAEADVQTSGSGSGGQSIDVANLSASDRENLHLELFRQALTAQMAGDIAKAIALYDQALAVRPDSADAHFNRGIALRDLGRMEEALACYDRAIAVSPEYAEAHYNRGNALQMLGRFEESLEAYERAALIKPDYIEAKNNQGIAFKALGRYKEALAAFDRVCKINPSYVPAHNQRGTVLEKLGRYKDALKAYDRAVKLRPDYAEAYNNSGNAFMALGKDDKAMERFERACALKPGYALPHYNRGTLLEKSGRYEEALAAYHQVIALSPAFAEAYNRRGATLKELGRIPEALAAFERACAIHPGFAEAHVNRGDALQILGRHRDSLEAYDRAIALKPDFALAHNNRGAALTELKRYPEALAAFEQAAGFAPDYAESHYHRGFVLHALGRPEEALEAYGRALNLNRNDFLSHYNRGNILQELGRFEEAISAFKKAASLNPAFPETYNNWGITLQRLGRYEDALAVYDKALAADAGFVKAHGNRGFVLQELKRFDEALEAYNRAIVLDPSYADAQWNKSLLLLLQGQLEEGLRLYEWRRKVVPAAARAFSRPLWLGDSELRGKTLLLYHEQGFGDTVQMLRYLPLLAQKGAKILVEVPTSLASLLQVQPEVSQVLVRGDALPDFDCQCPFMSLPLAFSTTLSTIPSNVPYLKIPEDQVSFWKNRLGPKTRPRIGLTWSGAAKHWNDANRSIPLEKFLLLLEKDAEFHSLQVEYREADLELLRKDGRIVDHLSDIKDFSDTAALIAEMDLILTVDTSVAHLAGALGKPVRILLPWVPDFRWLLDRSDSPWYPTAKLFRQSTPRNWEDVIEKVIEIDTL